MTQHELVLSGLGGQGILVASQLLGHAAVVEGKRAMYFSMFQGAQRGGVCECLVTIADGRVESSPVIMQPIVAGLTMHPNAFRRFEPLVKPGGLLVYNTSIKLGTSDTETTTGEGLAMKVDTVVDIKPARGDIAYMGVPASDLALQELGNPLMATLIATGAFVELTGIVTLESAKESLTKALKKHRQSFIPINQRALDLGANYARERGELVNPGALRLLRREATAA